MPEPLASPDDAKYMCLLQGAIWTLRIGLILHLGFLIGWMTRILQNRYFVLALSVTAIAAYVTLVDTAVKIPEFGEKIGDALLAFRLGYAYLAGVAIFMWQDKLRLNGRRIIFSTLSVLCSMSPSGLLRRLLSRYCPAHRR